MNIAVVFERIGPYHDARIRAASQVAKVTAVEFVRMDRTYDWHSFQTSGYNRETLSEGGPFLIGGLKEKLDRLFWSQKFDVVAVPGWGDVRSLVAAASAREAGSAVVVFSESQRQDRRRFALREHAKRIIMSLFDAALVGGERHRRYAVELGMPEDRIFLGYDVVDNEYFARARKEILEKEQQIRRSLGLQTEFLLAVSRLVEKKNLFVLLDAFREYLATATSARSLVIAGDGVLRSQLERYRDESGLGPYVHFAGFVQYDLLPAYYSLARGFVHASTVEQWGLVVNEAMASSLPVIVSDHCGCVPELVRDGVNGFVVSSHTPTELTKAMVKLDFADADAMGRKSLEIVSGWSPNTFANGLLKAAEAAVRFKRRPGMLAKGITTFARILD